MLVHHVYFTLNDNSPAKCAELVDACKKYLTDHPGSVFFSAGALTPDLDRDVNDRDFDVALSVVFETREAHDAYQVAERHNQFIAEQKDNWKQVRVFDSDA
ncbi:MAG: Dabb family protein [Pirellulales bacterium]|nr:Dabb family protein [Pirellulales bacterium]